MIIKEIAEDVGDFRVLLAWPKATRLNQRAHDPGHRGNRAAHHAPIDGASDLCQPKS